MTLNYWLYLLIDDDLDNHHRSLIHCLIHCFFFSRPCVQRGGTSISEAWWTGGLYKWATPLLPSARTNRSSSRLITSLSARSTSCMDKKSGTTTGKFKNLFNDENWWEWCENLKWLIAFYIAWKKHLTHQLQVIQTAGNAKHFCICHYFWHIVIQMFLNKLSQQTTKDFLCLIDAQRSIKFKLF